MLTRQVVDTLPEFPNEQVTFYRRGGTFTLDEAYPSRKESTTTDDNGAYSIDLWPNAEGLSETSYLAVYPGKDSFEFVLEPGDDPITASELRAQYAWNWHTTPVPTAIALERARYANKVNPSLGSGLIGFILNAIGAVGRWVQEKLSEVYSPEDFGAVGDGATDDILALESFLAAGGGRLGRKKVYAISRQWNLRPSDSIGPHIDGNYATIKAIAGTWNAGDSVAFLNSPATIQGRITKLVFNANGLATYGFRAIRANGGNTEFSELYATGATLTGGYGFYFRECQITSFRNLNATGNAKGMMFWGCNAATAINLRANSNFGTGVEVRTEGIFAGGMTLYRVTSESNTGHGIDIDTGLQGGPINVIDPWVEYVTGDGIRINSRSGRLIGGRISGQGNADGTNWAIHLLSGAANWEIRPNFLARETGVYNYATVRTEAGVTGCRIEPNYSLYGATAMQTTADTAEDWPSAVREMPNGLFVESALGIGTLTASAALTVAGGISAQGISTPDLTVGEYQNLLLYSEDLSVSPWNDGLHTSTTLVTDGSVVAPNGVESVSKIEMSGSGIQENRVYQISGAVGTLTGRTFVAAVQLIAPDGEVDVQFYLGNGNDGNNIVVTHTVRADRWTLFSIAKTFGTEPLTSVRFSIRSAATLVTPLVLYAWGAQLEEVGSGESLPGGYVKTEAAAVAGRGLVSSGLLSAPAGLAGQGGATGSRPASPVLYQEFFDTTLHKKICWDGSVWRDGAGASV